MNIRFSDNPEELTYNGWNIRQPVRRNILNNFEQIQYNNLPPEHPCDPTHKMGVFFKARFLDQLESSLVHVGTTLNE